MERIRLLVHVESRSGSMATLSKARVALVTGCSRGIGRAISLGLARDGFNVLVNDISRQQTSADSLVSEIKALGRQAIPFLADVSNKTEVNGMVETAISEWGHIDAVVNNAGILRVNMVKDTSESDWDCLFICNKGNMEGSSTSLRSVER